jgi:phosphatidylethanolamine-binding protein (PEBP) family uncharacterized protein
MRLKKSGLGLAVAGSAILAMTTGASAFSASFRWCGGSPAFSLNGVPKGTAKIDFEMTDLNVPSYRHGGGSVVYKGQKSIPCGAFDGNFVGPSPPPPQVHTYEFDITARGAGGEVLGKTTARRKFP